MSDLARAEIGEAACTANRAWQRLGMYPSAAAASMRGRDRRERTTAVVEQERREQCEQIENGKQEQPVSGATIGLAPVQLLCEQKEKRAADYGGSP
jgi:hypothetical protein